MASPMAAQRIYYRVEKTLTADAGAFTSVELTGLPVKGLLRRVRLVDATATTVVRFIFSESEFATGVPVGGEMDVISQGPALGVTTPEDLIADSLTMSSGDNAVGNEGIPFELTPSETDHRSGTMWLGFLSTVTTTTLILQLTIEPLFP